MRPAALRVVTATALASLAWSPVLGGEDPHAPTGRCETARGHKVLAVVAAGRTGAGHLPPVRLSIECTASNASETATVRGSAVGPSVVASGTATFDDPVRLVCVHVVAEYDDRHVAEYATCTAS